MPVSLKDVAAHAKVSPATVSGVLNRRSYCWASEETAKRVMESARELGYVPNRAARGLRTQRFMTLGLILPDLTNPFNAMVSRLMTERLAEAGYAVVLEDNMASIKNEEQCYERILERQVDGVFLILIDHEKFFREHPPEKLPKPTVVLGPAPAGLRLDAVDSDMKTGVSEAMEHLLSFGHKRIAFFGGRIGGIPMDDERLKVVIAVLKKHGLSLAPHLRLSSHVSLARAFETFDAFLRDTPRGEWPTAVLALNDLVAMAIIGAAQRHALSVPRNLSVVGIDDIEFVRYLPTPLSTIAHSLNELIGKSVEIMLSRLNSSVRTAPKQVKFPMKFIARESTGPAS
jgi:LacI family transcriptional regulator